MTVRFLPELPIEAIKSAFAASPGNELKTGKFDNPESSAALAANTFGWFLERPEYLPPLPRLEKHWPPQAVAIESEMRFPWSGGTHPWLDASIVTDTALIGIESKRYEPFRGKPKVNLSLSYDRPVWGGNMSRYCDIRDKLRKGSLKYESLDAAQLVKHAFGLRTQTASGGRFEGLRPILLYLFAEPQNWASGRLVSTSKKTSHRAEIADFVTRTTGDEVLFIAIDYKSLLDLMMQSPLSGVAEHAERVRQNFGI